MTSPCSECHGLLYYDELQLTHDLETSQNSDLIMKIYAITVNKYDAVRLMEKLIESYKAQTSN